MLQKSKTSTHLGTHSLEQPLYHGSSSDDQDQKEFSLLCHDKQPFFLRLLQRDNSFRSSSWHKLAPSFVPFVWESSPGLPKPNWLNLNTNEDYNSFFNPLPLAPPPVMQHQNSSHNNLIKLHTADGSLASKIKTALRRSFRTASSGSLFLISSSLSGGMAAARDECSPSSCSFDTLRVHELPDQYINAGCSNDHRGGKLQAHCKKESSQAQNTLTVSSMLSKRNSSKIKGCWCFRIPACKS
eukprot:c43259_g1_i1 orf=404-1126(+)